MKIIHFTIFFLLATTFSHAQILKKFAIEGTGCSFSSYCDTKFTLDYSSDSSKVYTGECKLGDISYGVICVQLLNPIADLTAAEDMMIAYLDYLKTTFSIDKAIGYNKGHRLNKDENTRGIADQWVDSENDKWRIKIWTNGSFIGFVYAYSSKEIPELKVSTFLNEFRFPEMK